jgi:hypothetical protein
VNKEQECPDQIILGANHPNFCCLIGSASYLECHFTESLGVPLIEQPITTVMFSRSSGVLQSSRLYPMKFVVRLGCTLFVNLPLLGLLSMVVPTTRWKSAADGKDGQNGRVVNLYINVKQLPTDGKVASFLCVAWSAGKVQVEA